MRSGNDGVEFVAPRFDTRSLFSKLSWLDHGSVFGKNFVAVSFFQKVGDGDDVFDFDGLRRDFFTQDFKIRDSIKKESGIHGDGEK